MHDADETRAGAANPVTYRIRRPPTKDALLGDEPPRFLTVAIVLIAVMLSTLTAVCWSFEYEETVPIALDAGSDLESRYALGYVPASVDVKVGQKVHLPRRSTEAATNRTEATVFDVSGPTKEGLYIVRVGMPEGVREPGAEWLGQQNNDGHISGTLVTKKIRIFARLFGVFRNITRSG